ncbi:GNAT family N-acetyltransferase [Rummeliibacillus sp. TYF005]|uniref:GNAT family N-acetyltransferase n=1 Tax=Rummeliibacillus sp. TYF005 TaxID=2058214 RepID=UPI000F52EFF9|nr:GNAT family N-acetyltransferase [Rummeliibacillus sp. TYF005]RPJ95235.1 N-acetyltransferase [Rummeliibacillus sp. TYF005]
MNFRLATLDDLEWIIDLRKQLLIEEGQIVSSNIDEELNTFFENQLTSHQYVQWLVEEDNKVIATGAIQFISFPPSYFNPTGIRGYILNMYTHPDYRGKGIAKQLVNETLKEAQSREVQHIFLISSEMGKPLYKKIGFKENDIYMEYFLPK